MNNFPSTLNARDAVPEDDRRELEQALAGADRCKLSSRLSAEEREALLNRPTAGERHWHVQVMGDDDDDLPY